MKTEIKESIEILTSCAACEKSDDALRYSQAALNLAHVAQVIRQTEITSVSSV